MLGGGPSREGRSRRRRDPSLRNGVCLLLFVLLCSPSHLGYNALGSMRLVDGANSPASAAPLRVYVVPHSHCDPGWWKTVDEYFADWAEGVISSAVETLSENKERRFIWSEISFFRLWWDKHVSKRDTVRRLVSNGQLEFVNGAWVQPDEASPSAAGLTQSWIAGHEWLKQNVFTDEKDGTLQNHLPRIGWAIDPFGHSRAAAAIALAAGMDALVINRIPKEDNDLMRKNQELEFYWQTDGRVTSYRGSDGGKGDSLNPGTAILTHTLAYPLYDIPNTCGPDWNTCAQFDFERPVARPITPQNVAERSRTLLGQYKQKAAHFPHRHLLIPLGDDFKYKNAQVARNMFENYELMFDHINANAEAFGVEKISFATLSEYFAAVRAETTGSESSAPLALPVFHGDFFTYTDRENAYWSGYFTTRPALKLLMRRCERMLRLGDSFASLLAGQDDSADTQAMLARLTKLRETVALFEHHDGITGTSRHAVVADYAMRLGRDLQAAVNDAVLPLVRLATNHGPELKPSTVIDAGGQPRDAARETVVSVPDEASFGSIVVTNSLLRDVDDLVSVLVTTTFVDRLVVSLGDNAVVSQVSPVWSFETPLGVKSNAQMPVKLVSENVVRVWFRASVAAMSAETYILSVAATAESDGVAALAGTSLHFSKGEAPLAQSSPFKVSNDLKRVSSKPLELAGGGGVTVYVNAETGLLLSVASVPVAQSYMKYSQTRGGAYIFSPTADAVSLEEQPDVVASASGPLIQEAASWHIAAKSEVAIPWRIVRRRSPATPTCPDADVEVQHMVTLMSRRAHGNTEVLLRLDSAVKNSFAVKSGDTRPHLLTDANGLQLIPRHGDPKAPLSRNHFPVSALAAISSDCALAGTCSESDGARVRDGATIGATFTHACAVASLKEGSLDVIIDRRLNQDDGRGLGEPVNDNSPHISGVRLLVAPHGGEPATTREEWWDLAELQDGVLQVFHGNERAAHSFVPLPAHGASGEHLRLLGGIRRELSSDISSRQFVLSVRQPSETTSVGVVNSLEEVFGSCVENARLVPNLVPGLRGESARNPLGHPSGVLQTACPHQKRLVRLASPGDSVATAIITLAPKCVGKHGPAAKPQEKPPGPDRKSVVEDPPIMLGVRRKPQHQQSNLEHQGTTMYILFSMSFGLMAAAMFCVVARKRTRKAVIHFFVRCLPPTGEPPSRLSGRIPR